MKETPEFKPHVFDGDYVVVGTRVWASSFTPPIRTFIKDNMDKLKNKKTGVFMCLSGMGADKAVEKLKQFMNINEFDAKLILIDPKDKMSDEKLKAIDDFCKNISK